MRSMRVARPQLAPTPRCKFLPPRLDSRQADEGLSLEAQERRVLDYIEPEARPVAPHNRVHRHSPEG